MNEGEFKVKVIEKLEEMFPGCEIFGPGLAARQGVPDLVILWGSFWASLEFKKSATARKQPNQSYYIDKLDDMSFAAFIYPENEEEVLCALEQAFKPPGRARVSKPKQLPLDSLHTK